MFILRSELLTLVVLSQPVVLGDDDQELTKLYSVDSSLYSTVRSQNTELLSMLKKRPHEQHTMSSESTRETLNREEAAERQDNDSDASQLPLKKHRKIVSKQNTDVSQNFVKLNMKIKRYKRKGQSVSQKYKKYRFGKGKNVCYKCGVKGHWARDCPTSQNLGTFDGAEVQYCSDGDRSESPDSDSQTVGIDEKQPSLGSTQEIQCSVECKVPEVDGNHTGSTSKGGQLSPGKKRTSKSSVKTKRPATKQNSFAYKKIASVESITEASLPLHTSHTSLSFSPVDPLYSVGDDMSDVLQGVLEKFGFVDFRTSQRKVIERILTGQSTLFVQSTGSGKSLCYQVPAYLYWERYKAITVVVSPLVSLMEDQVRNLPTCLSGACLHSNMDPKERQSVYDRMRAGSIAVLLVSPEAVVVDRGAGFWNALSSVAFVCIDEAHCVSQWSHNFRPSYLRICKIFYERCHISCFLGLTATATKSTVDSVAEYLKLPEEGVVQGQILPPNLRLSVSSDNDKDAALLHLLQSEPFRSCDSIIIYCTRQQSTERVAQSIRTCLQSLDSFAYLRSSEEDKRSRKMKTEVADCYHAGMSGHMRSRVQKKFMSGRLRIVAATVAFGMGLNKADVRAIIHYNMPRSFESYVQEIGRAGRDGKPAYCHVFLDLQDEDNNELRRHIHANSVDRFAVKQLISHLVIPPVSSCTVCAPPTTTQEVSSKQASSNTAAEQVAKSGRRHLVAVNIAECVNACDVKEETLMTYLCYLEFEHWLEFSKTANDTCVLKFYGGRCQVDQLARKMDVVAAAIECNAVTGGGTQVELSFSISAVSNRVGRPWDEVQRQLYMLQYDDQGTGTTGGQRSGILVEFLHPSYIILVSCGYSPQDLDCMCDQLYNRVQQQESSDLAKLKLLHEALRKASLHDSMTLDTGSSELRSVIDNYFSDKLEAPKMKTTREVLDGLTEKQQVRVCRDIRSFLAIHEEHKVTARAIARIFHGISSPNFPADVWGRERRFWRSHINVDFHVLIKLAQEQIVTFLTVV
jgi:ATP-dependent DNA helicase Q4